MENGYIAIIVLGIALVMCISALKAHSQQGVAIMCRANEEKAKAAIQQEQARAYRAMMRKVYFYTQLQAVDLAAPIPCTIQSDVAVGSDAPEAHYVTPCSPARNAAATGDAEAGNSSASTPSSVSSSVRKKKKKSEVTLPELRLPQSLSRSSSRSNKIAAEEVPASPVPMDTLAS